MSLINKLPLYNELFDKCEYKLCSICKNFNKVNIMYECGGLSKTHTYECFDCQSSIKYTTINTQKKSTYKPFNKYTIFYYAICSILTKLFI